MHPKRETAPPPSSAKSAGPNRGSRAARPATVRFSTPRDQRCGPEVPRGEPPASLAEDLEGCAVRVLSGLTGRCEASWVRPLLSASRAWMGDLPASERHHHARPGGLDLHSREVAAGALLELSRRWDENGCHRFVAAEELPEVSRITFAVGLLHDCGKLLDLEVRLPDPEEAWDPRAESLAQFRSRRTIPPTAPTPYRFHRGRTLARHEQRGADLVRRILAGRCSPYFDEETVSLAYFAYARRYDAGRWEYPIRFLYLGELVQRADQASVREDRWRNRTAAEPKPAEGPDAVGARA